MRVHDAVHHQPWSGLWALRRDLTRERRALVRMAMAAYAHLARVYPALAHGRVLPATKLRVSGRAADDTLSWSLCWDQWVIGGRQCLLYTWNQYDPGWTPAVGTHVARALLSYSLLPALPREEAYGVVEWFDPARIREEERLYHAYP